MKNQKVKYINVVELRMAEKILNTSISLLSTLLARDEEKGTALIEKEKREIGEVFQSIVAEKAAIKQEGEWAYGFIVADKEKKLDGTSCAVAKACARDWQMALYLANDKKSDYLIAVNQKGFEKVLDKLGNQGWPDDTTCYWFDSYAD